MTIDANDAFSIDNTEEVEMQQQTKKTDKTKTDSAGMTVTLIAFTLVMVLMFGGLVLLYLTFYTVPVVSVTSLYMGQRLYRGNFEHLRDRALNTTNMRHKREFVTVARIVEYPWNFGLTLANYAIVAWNLTLPIITWLWQNFKDVLFVFIRKIFSAQTLTALGNMMAMVAEVAQIIVFALMDLMTGLLQLLPIPNVGTSGSTGAAPSPGNDWNVTANPFAQVNAFLVRLSLLLIQYSAKYILLLNLSSVRVRCPDLQHLLPVPRSDLPSSHLCTPAHRILTEVDLRRRGGMWYSGSDLTSAAS